MTNSRPSRVSLDRHKSDELVIWRRKHKLEEFSIPVDRFAELIGVPTVDVIASIGDIQVIESDESTIQGFIDNESDPYDMEKGDIITLTEGRNTYAYIYNPLFSGDKTNSDNYTLLSYFRSPDYSVIVVSDEDELYSAMSEIAEVSAGDILFANDIQLTKNLEAILDNVTIKGNKKTLILHDDDDNSFKINLNTTEVSTGVIFENVTFRSSEIEYVDSNFNESKTILEVVNTYAGSGNVSLEFNNCIFSNCVGYDSGTTSGNYNIIDPRGDGYGLDVIVNGGYNYCSLNASTTKSITNYPFTISKLDSFSDFATVSLKSSDFKMHSTGRTGNLFSLVTGLGTFDSIATDGTFTICKYAQNTTLSDNTTTVSGNELMLQYNIDSTSDQEFFLPHGFYIDSISAETATFATTVTDFAIGIGVVDDDEKQYYINNIDLNTDVNYIFTNNPTISASQYFEIYPLNKNLSNSTSATGMPLSITAGSIGGVDIYIKINLKRYTDKTINSIGDSTISSNRTILPITIRNISADETFTDFFPSGYILKTILTENNTANIITALNLTDETSNSFLAGSSAIGDANKKGVCTLSPTALSTSEYEYVRINYPALFSSSNRDLIISALDWNGSNVTITFYLEKLL